MSTSVRTYGGWRERRGFGIGSLSGTQTALGLGLVIVGLAVVLVLPAALPLLLVPALGIGAMTLIRIRGESVAAVTGRHVRWRRRLRNGGVDYRSSAQLDLPDALAGVELVGSDMAILRDTSRRTATAIVPVEPQGLEFADPDLVDSWVAGWGQWLAHLGYVPDLLHVTVTVFSWPLVAAAAPGLLGEILTAQQPEIGSRTLVSITLRNGDREPPTGQLRDAVASLQALESCGMHVLPPLTSEDAVQWVRACYDPSVPMGGVQVVWPDARPTATRESWDRYQHDAFTSAVFAWDECPGEAVGPHVVAGLLGPAGYPKRVAMVFTPVPAHAAAREVDRQAEAAMFRSQYRRRLGRDETARDRLDVERARQTATEQAHGSGLVDVTVFAAASAPDDAALEQAAADLHNRAGQARLRLRRAYGEQAAAFTATLGVGYVP